MDPCTFLEWDSDFFGYRIARANITPTNRGNMERILAWSRQNKIDCVYVLLNLSDTQAIWQAEQHGFRLMDIRVTLASNLRSHSNGSNLPARIAHEADIPMLKLIARGGFPDTRFYRDWHFAPQGDRFYETWIEVNVRGRADAVLVSEAPTGEITGFVSCHASASQAGEIGLLAVHKSHRGQGIGSYLVCSAKAWFGKSKIHDVRVVTNGANINAQRLYQGNGFRSTQMQAWFHHWE